jgi:hypothetical protein
MNSETSITQWIENFDNGMYNSEDVDTQCDAGWYDWFCKDTSLRNKTYKLAEKVKKIANILGEEFCNSHYLFFKNNCPMMGKLYDDFRFCDIKEGGVTYTITPSSGFDSERNISTVWGKENNFENVLIEGTWKDVVNFFASKVK